MTIDPFKQVFDPFHYPLRYYLVVVGENVTNRYANLEDAKNELATFPPKASSPSRLIAEVNGYKVKEDPHTVGGQNQGGGVDSGFNKWWWDWNDIKRMIAIAENYIEVPQYYVVVVDNKVTDLYTDIEKAKEELNTFPPAANKPSRLIAEVNGLKVNPDPHKVGGQNQGGGVEAGFNKWWWDWNDINRMIAIAQAYIEPKQYFMVVVDDKVTNTYEHIEKAKEELNTFPSGADKPSRLIAEVNGLRVNPDPHTVGGQNQGGGVDAGFNKWWWDWNDINRMLGIAQNYASIPRYYAVVVADKVTNTYVDIEKAKTELNTFPLAANSPSRLIAEVNGYKVKTDPHSVGGQNQGGGVDAGFNKWWWNWNDINKMIAVAQAYADPPQCFAVVVGDAVTNIYGDIEKAKEELNGFPPAAEKPSRLIAEVNGYIVNEDPHKVGGQNQGGGVEAGFNKWWWDWKDIHRMIHIAEKTVLNITSK